MDKVDRDDFIHALTQTFLFYDKEFDKMKATFWVDACGEFSVERLKLALREHVKRGKFAPKPADILDIVREKGMRQAEVRADRALPDWNKLAERKPEELDYAWMYCIKLFCLNSDGVIGKSMGAEFKRVDSETEERYLHLVNHHAHQQDMPDAIPDEFKLREVWG